MNIKIIQAGAIATNCYIVYDENKNAAIIDCEGSGKDFIDFIDKNGLNLTHILITHGHHDHVGAVKAIKSKYGSKVYLGENEIDTIRHYNLDIKPDAIVKDNDIIKVGDMVFRAIETPGHTKGGMCYVCQDAIFSGDTMFREDCGRCDLYGSDFEAMKDSLKRLSMLEGDYNVYPGHDASTTLEHERKHNQYIPR